MHSLPDISETRSLLGVRKFVSRSICQQMEETRLDLQSSSSQSELDAFYGRLIQGRLQGQSPEPIRKEIT
jgi:hypothetical protein